MRRWYRTVANKMKKILAFVCVVMLIGLVGCKKKDKVTEGNLVGLWSLVEYEESGYNIPATNEPDWLFKKNHDFQLLDPVVESRVYGEGIWSLNGKELTIDSEELDFNDGENLFRVTKLTSSKLVLEADVYEDGQKFVFTRIFERKD